MAQPFVPGPAPVWVAYNYHDPLSGQAPNGEVLFLGYSARGVDLAVFPQYSPWSTDAGKAPVDLIYEGATGVVSAEFTRWNEETYAAIADHAAPTLLDRQSGKRGRHPVGRAGTIMGLERAALCVLVAFPYSAPPGRYTAMPAGYRFPLCVLDREGLPERGSKPARLALNFRCLRTLQRKYLESDAYPADGSDLYVLYDTDLSMLAGRTPD